MNIARFAQLSIYLLTALVVMTMGWMFPQLNFKGVAVSILITVLLVITVIPMKWALLFCLIYIGFEGFLKIISDYHPLVHIGSDVVVVLLFLRTLLKSFSRGNPLPNHFPPLFALFLFHFSWVVITLFNPYSLGVVSSIAGSKIYVTMPLLFFFAYYECESLDDFHFFIRGIIFVAILHTGFGLYQAVIGPESVLSLHPRYAIQLEKYKNTAFRPFGLTNLPGGPAVYLAPVLPLAMYYAFVQKNVMRLFLISFCSAGLSLVFLCQIRSALLKVILGCAIFVIGYLFIALRSKEKRKVGVGAIVFAAIMLSLVVPKLLSFSITQNEENEYAVERSLTLFDIEKISRARRATFGRFVTYLQDVPFGAGFSRVGAAGGAFQNLKAKDPFFKEDYFFADNFWIACLVEVGIPGMLALTAIIFMILYKGAKSLKKLKDADHRLAICALLGATVPLIVGLYGSEGILYNPDAFFFWFLSGILLKIPSMKNPSDL